MRTNPNRHSKPNAIFILILLWIALAQAHPFAGGTGELNDPYEIATAEQLVAIGSDPNLLDKFYVLVADIDLDPNLPGGQVFTQAVIAANADNAFAFDGAPFNGSFAGNGHVIKNLSIRARTGHYLGLFGKIQGEVHDLRLEAVSINGARCAVGTLAGINWGIIVGCRASGTISASEGPYNEGLGGLVGLNTCSISESCATTNVHSEGNTVGFGGLVGVNFLGRIVRCYAMGEMVADDGGQTLGGLVGSNVQGTIVNCYARGSVSSQGSTVPIGGLVGFDEAGTIVYCYAAGSLLNG